MAGKYEPLKNYLTKLKQDSIRLRFSEIEKILGFNLPRSAYDYSAWWANGGHAQAEAWKSAGYKVGSLDLNGGSVVFVKVSDMGKTISKDNMKRLTPQKPVATMKNANSNFKAMLCCGYEFRFIQNLAPVLDETGEIKKYYPQDSYFNKKGLPLSPYGKGAFCRFSIEADDVPGVYLWVVDDEIIYIGETIGLRRRFNMGYGNISTRNCFVGGQNTNCKMNKIVLALYEQGKVISLYFHRTKDYKQVELNLLNRINTQYNVKNN